MKIGNIKLKNRLILAPMVDVTDLAYRILCRRYGAALAFTEMTVIDSILCGAANSKKLIETCDEDKPSGVQIAGYNPLMFKKVIPYLKDFDIIDVNFGCPVHKAENCGIGAILLKEPNKIKEILKTLKKNTDKVVMAKVRLGYDRNNISEIVKAVEDSGVDAITVHGRIATVGRSENADLESIRLVKEQVSIPVIGNGDIFTPEDTKEMLKIADFAMIARGAIGDPSILRRSLNYLDDGIIEEKPDFNKKINMFMEYCKLVEEYDLKRVNLKEKLMYFLKGLENSSVLREKVSKCKTDKEMFNVIGINLIRSR